MDADIIDDILDFLNSDMFDGLMAGMGMGAIVTGSLLDSAIKSPGGDEPIAKVQKEQAEFVKDLEALKPRLEKLQRGEIADEKEKEEIKDEANRLAYLKARQRIEAHEDEPILTESYQPRKNLLHGKLAEMNEMRGIMLRAVFHAIESNFHEGKLAGLSYYTLDFPFPAQAAGKSHQLVRLIRYPKEKEIKVYKVKKEKPYEAEPMFPRLFMEGEDLPKELNRETRLQAYSNVIPFIEKNRPYTDRQCEIMRLLIDNPKLTSSKIAKKLFVEKSTIDEQMKLIKKFSDRLFQVKFSQGKLVAGYWHEMGFLFP